MAKDAAQTAIDSLKRDMEALRADFDRALSAERRARAHAPVEVTPAPAAEASESDASGDPGQEVVSALEAKIREHPFAAVGLALAAGFLAASLGRKR